MRALIAIAVVGAVGCSSVDHASSDDAATRDDAGEVGGARTIEQACDDQVVARCREFEKCATWAEKWEFASEADCRSLGRQRCMDRAGFPGVVNPISWIDRCTAVLEARKCGDESSIDACLAPSREYAGTLPDGAKCVDDHQCSGGLCVVGGLPFFPTCGTCARLPLEGEACTTKDDCTGGGRVMLTCGASKRCEKRPPELGRPCSESAYCSPYFACVDGTCQQGSLPEGSACDAKTGCAPGLMCDSMKCVVPSDPVLVGPGESCTGDIGAPDGPYIYCRGEYLCVKGVCAPITHETCSNSRMLTCGWSAACRDDTNTCESLTTFCK